MPIDPSAAAPPPASRRTLRAISEVLDRERLMTLALTRPDGWPQATTVGFVNEGLELFLMLSRTSQKLVNLRADPRASVAIRSDPDGPSKGVGLSMAGRIEEVTDPAELARLQVRVAERYPDVHVFCPTGESVAVLRFRPCIVSAVGIAHGRSDPETFRLPSDPTIAGSAPPSGGAQSGHR